MVTFSPAVLALPPNHDGQIPLPPELVENIIDCFSDDPQMLVTCSLVSKEWSIRSRCHLFNLVDLNRETAERWRSIITPGPNGASCLVRTLTLRQSSIFPWLETKPLDAFSDHFSSFQNVERLFITWLDLSRFEPGSLARHFAHYGPSLRSLHLTYLRADYSTLITFLQLFPNLEELLIHIPRLFDDRPPPLTSRPATNTRGTLNLSSFGLDSSPFIPHLTGFDLRFSSISLYQCDFSSGSSLSDLLEASASSLRHLELKHITFSKPTNISFARCENLQDITIGVFEEGAKPLLLFALLSTLSSFHLTHITIHFIAMPNLHWPAWKTLDAHLLQMITRCGLRQGPRVVLRMSHGVESDTVDGRQLLPNYCKIGTVELRLPA